MNEKDSSSDIGEPDESDEENGETDHGWFNFQLQIEIFIDQLPILK